MSTQPLNYCNYDFDTLVAQLQARLALKSTWKDMYRSSTGEMLIELFAAVGNLVLYYIERRAEESYILTAKNRTSIINLARLLNYSISRPASSTGTLRFSLSSPATKLVFIPKYTSVSSSSYNFVVANDGVINVGQSYSDVIGIQGTKQVITYTSSGALNQEYNINDTKIENSNIVITVTPTGTTTPVVWTSVSSFINSINTSTDFVIRPEIDDTITIVFGNNVFGKSPATGDIITVTYIQSDGSAGNVYSTGSITTLNSTIYDQDGVAQTVTVSNTTTFLGGDDIETTEEIRENAPNVFATGDRLVTKSDFVSVINAYPQVADSNAWGEAEEATPDYSHYNQVKLVVILDGWILPDTSFKNTLSDYLYEKSLMTVRYSYVDPVILEVIPAITVKCNLGSSLSYVQSLIETAVSDEFILGDTTRLGLAHRESDIVAAIEAVPGVSYSHASMIIRKELSSTYDSNYNWSETMDALELVAGAVSIYIDDTQIAIDDGAYSFTDTTTSYTVTGIVNYITGKVGVDISPAPAALEKVYCRYKQDKDGDIEPTKSQICKWIKNDYLSISYVS